MSSAWVTLGLVAVLAAMHALLQKELPAYALLLSLGAIVLLLVRLGGTFRSVLEGVALLGQQTDKQAFQCLLRSTGILLLADYTRTLCKESGAEALGCVQGLRAAVWCWRQCSHCWKKCVNGSGGWQDERQKIPGVSGRVGISGRNAFWNGAGFRT